MLLFSSDVKKERKKRALSFCETGSAKVTKHYLNHFSLQLVACCTRKNINIFDFDILELNKTVIFMGGLTGHFCNWASGTLPLKHGHISRIFALSQKMYFFSFWIKTLQEIYRNIGLVISNLLSESIFNPGKWSNWKCASTPNACIFS